MSRIGEQRYNLLFNNCEHFANWCKTGRHRSSQVEDWMQTSSLGALALGQIIPAALLTGLSLLLRRGLVDETSRERARQAIAQLKSLRVNLLNKLEATLEQAEGWLHGAPDNNLIDHRNSRSRSLLLKGHTLADEQAAIISTMVRIGKGRSASCRRGRVIQVICVSRSFSAMSARATTDVAAE